jgi:hypothetical protein
LQGEETLERSPTKTQGSYSPLPKSPSMDEMSDYKDVKIKELEDTIKVLMEKLSVCGDGQMNGIDPNYEALEVNGVDHNDGDMEEDIIE